MALRTEGERTRAILPAHRSAHRSAAPAISVVLGLVRFVFCLFAYLLSSVCAGPLCFMKGWTAHYFRLGPSYSRSAGLRPCAPLVRPPAPPTSSSHRHPITLAQNDARTVAHARTHTAPTRTGPCAGPHTVLTFIVWERAKSLVDQLFGYER